MSATQAISTMTSETWSILAGQKYVQRFVRLEEGKFGRSLARDVSNIFARIEGGFENYRQELRGKAEVERFFHDHLFQIAGKFDLRKVAYRAFGTQVEMTCEINEDKLVEGVKRRYHKDCFTQLDFKVDAGALKIGRIFVKNTQDEIGLSPVSSAEIDSTEAILAGQKYIDRFMQLEEEKFYDSLTPDVHAEFTVMKGVRLISEQKVEGKEALENDYHNKFFSITNNFDLQEISYEYIGDGVLIKGVAEEDVIEDKVVNRYHKRFSTELKFRNEESALKICGIWASKHQNLISSRPV